MAVPYCGAAPVWPIDAPPPPYWIDAPLILETTPAPPFLPEPFTPAPPPPPPSVAVALPVPPVFKLPLTPPTLEVLSAVEVPPLAVNEPKLELPPLLTDVEFES